MEKEMIGDLVVYGKAYTAEKDNEICDAFVVKDGKYIYVGSIEGAKNYIKEGVTKIIDNKDKGLIIPGCTEGHAHFVGVDALLRSMPGFYSSYEELLEVIKEGVNKKEISDFFVSFGFNYNEFCAKQDPKKSYAEELESIAPSIPIILLDCGGHQAICSTTALNKAGITIDSKIRGGEIQINEVNELSGIVSDEVVVYVLEKALDLKNVKPEVYKEACLNAIDTLHKRGYTNFFDAYINYLTGTNFYKYLKELDEDNKLNVNITTSYTLRSFEANEYKEKIDYMIEQGKKYQSKHFNPFTLKLFEDGVVESYTGYMLEEYPCPVNGKKNGNIIWTKEELKDIVSYANNKDIPVHTHTFGDGACNAVIDAYIYAKEKTNSPINNTLAHVRNIKEEDKDRCANNNIIICENLIWHVDTIPDDESYNKTLEERKACFQQGAYENGYPMKSLVDKGIVVTSSTDAPAAEEFEGNILNIIEVCVTGKSPYKNNVPYNTKELLTIKEALNCLTINGAKQLGIDDRCGSIKLNKNADFIILDTDFLDYPKEKYEMIHNTKIKNIFFEGKEVYTNN